MARTLTHAGNFDAKEFGDRLSAAVPLEGIFFKRPEWKRAFGRLNWSLDHSSWLDGGPNGGADGNSDVRKVDIKSCWDGGRREATEILQEHSDFSDVALVTFEELGKMDVTMLLPFGLVKKSPSLLYISIAVSVFALLQHLSMLSLAYVPVAPYVKKKHICRKCRGAPLLLVARVLLLIIFRVEPNSSRVANRVPPTTSHTRISKVWGRFAWRSTARRPCRG